VKISTSSRLLCEVPQALGGRLHRPPTPNRLSICSHFGASVPGTSTTITQRYDSCPLITCVLQKVIQTRFFISSHLTQRL
jgi:hypothetical protein